MSLIGRNLSQKMGFEKVSSLMPFNLSPVQEIKQHSAETYQSGFPKMKEDNSPD